MIHLTFRTNALLITMPLLALLASSNTHAEIYKWRDNRGVTQYSDRPPVSSFSKLTSNELVNSLQTKDLCTVGPIKKSVASNAVASAKEHNGFFNFFSKSSVLTTPVKSVAVATNSFIGGAVTVMPFAKATISPIQIANATPASKPITPVNVPVTSNPTQPAKTTPSVTTPATQIATAPPATTNILNPVADVANIIQTALMPAVNISKNIAPVIGFDSIRVAQTNEIAPNSGGEFRISCKISHMSNDDPLVYPNQQGAAHHHTFFGNTSVNFKSDLNNFASTGNSTCSGGIMNRSAYWVPSIINTQTDTPVLPNDVLVYYKHGVIDGSLIKAPPKGLRMIAGDMKAKDGSVWNNMGFTCHPRTGSTRTTWPRTSEIPTGRNCESGDDLMFSIMFPQCWDGKNIDSPNHKDHMAYPLFQWPKVPDFVCPATHPIAIPDITVNVHYTVKPSDDLTKWRLSSDNYVFNGKNAGYSGHSDYVEGWDRKFLEGFVKNCLNAKKDCHAHLLGDGRTYY